MQTAYILTDLGFGDCGKGTTVDYLTVAASARTIVRIGGPQALHGVVAADGRNANFRHFGSGTLHGANTYLSKHMVVEPVSLLDQADALITNKDIIDAYQRLSIDSAALVITPLHANASNLRELARGANRHGTVGLGVGETIADAWEHPEDAIRIKDLSSKETIARKAKSIQERKVAELASEIRDASRWGEPALDAVRMITDPELPEDIALFLHHFGSKFRIIESASERPSFWDEDTIIIEPSQGMLLESWHGFHPHTTRSAIAPEVSLELLQENGFQGRTVHLGIMRAYQTRHGTGPFVSEDPELTQLLPDKNNGTHPWQGNFRVGYLDIVATRYALEAANAKLPIDGLVVTCLDRLAALPKWQMCVAYDYQGTASRTELSEFFELSVTGRIVGIKVHPNSYDEVQLAHQERLGELLRECRPYYTETKRSTDAFLRAVESQLGIPVAIASYGPTERDKQLLPT